MARIAVIGDIHGNLPALDAVLTQCGERDAVWCVGDTVGYGPYPNQCVARLSAMEAVAVAGNHDLGSLGKIDLLSFNTYARIACEWTGEVLNDDAREYLDSLALRKKVPHGSLLVHGSPRDPVWEYVLDNVQAGEVLGSFSERICFHGHSHVPMIYAGGPRKGNSSGVSGVESMQPQDGYRLNLEDDHRYLVNVGSVGQPRDGDPRACYVMFDSDEGNVTYRRAGYPVQEVQSKMAEEGLPEFLAARIAEGT